MNVTQTTGSYWRLIAALFLLFFGLSCQSQSADKDFSNYYDLVYQIRVVSPQAASKSSIGSGFQVSADGLLITNYHVVSGFVQAPTTHEIEYRSYRGETGKLELLDFDVVNDLAVLRLSAPQSRYFAFAQSELRKGEVVYALGNPRDYGVTLVPGPNNGMVEHSYNDQVLFSGSLNPGMSGGPALNESGEVVGVNVATAGAALSFLVPAAKARLLMDNPRKLAQLDYQNELADQIKAWQRARIQPLIDTKWPPEMFADEALFGEMRGDFQCWGNTNEDRPRRSIDVTSKSCRSANSVYLAGNLNTGQINYSFQKTTSIKLNASQFASSVESAMGADNRMDFDNATNYKCSSDFVNSANPSEYQRVTTCIRAYKRMTGLFDSLLLFERIGNQESFNTHLSIAGAEPDQIKRLNRKFVEASINE